MGTKRKMVYIHVCFKFVSSVTIICEIDFVMEFRFDHAPRI